MTKVALDKGFIKHNVNYIGGNVFAERSSDRVT